MKTFRELISPFLKKRIEELKREGRAQDAQRLEIQYKYNPEEEKFVPDTLDRHYHAGTHIRCVERLYEKECGIEITQACAAHCRFCLRSNYEVGHMSHDEIEVAVNYVAEEHLEEVLISGGDPFVAINVLDDIVNELNEQHPIALKIVRIATRTFTQEPELVNDRVLEVLKKAKKYFRVEVATHINTWVELEPEEVKEAIKKVQDLGITIYAQNVFLRGVNDSAEELIKLYSKMRLLGIEAHYLFHTVNMKGTDHLRTSVTDMIRCYQDAFNSGHLSGRCKPLLAIMADIGKVVLTPLNCIELSKDSVELKSSYKMSERIKYNKEWSIPEHAWLNDKEELTMRYKGKSETEY